MGESGRLSGLLGGEGEAAAEGSSLDAASTLDPMAASLAAEAARDHAELAQ